MAKLAVRFEITRIERNGACHVRDGGVEVVKILQHRAEIVVCWRVIGLMRQRPSISFRRCFELQRKPQVVPKHRYPVEVPSHAQPEARAFDSGGVRSLANAFASHKANCSRPRALATSARHPSMPSASAIRPYQHDANSRR